MSATTRDNEWAPLLGLPYSKSRLLRQARSQTEASAKPVNSDKSHSAEGRARE